MKTQYWENQNGAITCADCAGHYLSTALEMRPTAKSHTTPLGRFRKLSKADIASFLEMLKEMNSPLEPCETCRRNLKMALATQTLTKEILS